MEGPVQLQSGVSQERDISGDPEDSGVYGAFWRYKAVIALLELYPEPKCNKPLKSPGMPLTVEKNFKETPP